MFVAKIFSLAEITFNVAVVIFVVAEKTFKAAVITSSVVKITFVVVEIIFKVAVIISSVVFCSGLNNFFNG